MVPLSVDHRPRREITRIEKAGGFISDDDRVGGILMMSRAFGDRELKFVISL